MGGGNPKKIHARENAKKKNSCKEEGKGKKINAEGRSNCDFFRKSEFLSESLSSEINNITRHNMNKQESLSSY